MSKLLVKNCVKRLQSKVFLVELASFQNLLLKAKRLYRIEGTELESCLQISADTERN